MQHRSNATGDGGRCSVLRAQRQAFWNLESALLQTHCGKFVAIHDGEVVDCDGDEVQLGLRVYGKYGYRPIYFGLVSETPLPLARIPSPRLRRTACLR